MRYIALYEGRGNRNDSVEWMGREVNLIVSESPNKVNQRSLFPMWATAEL